MGLRVIGAGFGRTGTDSMRAALDRLGFGPTHHMRAVIDDPAQTRLWRAVAAGAAPDWDALFAGYRSAVDWPSAFYWRDLAAAWPEALVLLTWRTPESWWASFERTILTVIARSEDPDSLGLRLIAAQVFGGRPHDRDHAIRTYEANVEAVRATIPADRLLIHRIGDGWGPLCARLGVPVPDEPYPHRNAADDFFDRPLF